MALSRVGPFLDPEEWMAVFGVATAHQTQEDSPALEVHRVYDRMVYGIVYLQAQGYEFRQVVGTTDGVVLRPGVDRVAVRKNNAMLLGLGFPNLFHNARRFLVEHLPHLAEDIELLEQCERESYEAQLQEEREAVH